MRIKTLSRALLGLLLLGALGCLRGTNTKLTLVIDAGTLGIVGGSVESVTALFEAEGKRFGEVLITNPAGGPLFDSAELAGQPELRKSAVVSFKTTPSDFVLVRATGYDNAAGAGSPLVSSRGLVFLIRENDGDDNLLTLRFEIACGNGAIDEGEACDDGNIEAGDGCDCAIQFNCGNNTLDAGEGCDDGNNLGGDGCNAVCQVEFCGDGIDNDSANEECDDGNVVDTDACLSDCSLPSCGDGFVQVGVEDCEPPNSAVCDALCQDIALDSCGDGIVDAGTEQCDDANNADNDGCSGANCQVEAGFSCAGEPSVCVPLCGNGAIDAGETCDDNNNTAGDGCDANCQVEVVCGDGVKDATEGCDDGNVVNGDGCSSVCAEEVGFNCVGQGAGSCDPIGGEGCDDNNTAAGDGCDAACAEENGAACAGTPSVCAAVSCGDGIGAVAEQCDGADFRGETCASLNAATPAGVLACDGACQFDTTGCTP